MIHNPYFSLKFGCKRLDLEPADNEAYTSLMKRWKSFNCVLIALWLPLQGYAAVAMPFCQHSMAGTSGAPTSADHAHLTDAHAGMHHDDTGDPQASVVNEAGGLACDNCGACHLACAPAIFALVSVSLLVAGSVFESALTDSPHIFYPEQPQRPPLSALVLSAG